jgi:hypothetical protein
MTTGDFAASVLMVEDSSLGPLPFHSERQKLGS